MASVSSGEETGWRSVVLESDALRVVVLPEKGAEIHRLVDRESGIDVLFHVPWGLQPPGATKPGRDADLRTKSFG